MRNEEVFFYKLMLLCGYPEELNQAISTALDHQNPIEPDILDLSVCGNDAKKQLSVLNAILARDGEELLDHQAVFELVRQFLHRRYTGGMDLPALVKLMYRIAIETGWQDEEPWNTLFLMEDYYDDAQWGINGMEDFSHRLECLLLTADREDNCDIPISQVKQQVYLYEQQGKRLPVYHYLKMIWNTTPRSEDLTVLIMQQMMFYLIELESPWAPWETEDEHQTYQLFLHEALAYGFEKNIHEKKFMWNLCFFLEASSVYHCIFGDQIAIDYQIEHDRELCVDEVKAIEKMEELLHSLEPLLSRNTPCSNIAWIKTFMAFHNLPRVFFDAELRGFWNEPLAPVNLDAALESSSFFE